MRKARQPHLEVGVHGIHPELVRLLGRMKFRTSYGQNALKHSIEVAQLSGLLAGEVGVRCPHGKTCRTAYMISVNPSTMRWKDLIFRSVQISVRSTKNLSIVINAVESHHGDVEPTVSDCMYRSGSGCNFRSKTGCKKRDTRDLYQQIKTVGRYYELLQGSR